MQPIQICKTDQTWPDLQTYWRELASLAILAGWLSLVDKLYVSEREGVVYYSAYRLWYKWSNTRDVDFWMLTRYLCTCSYFSDSFMIRHSRAGVCMLMLLWVWNHPDVNTCTKQIMRHTQIDELTLLEQCQSHGLETYACGSHACMHIRMENRFVIQRRWSRDVCACIICRLKYVWNKQV